MCLIAVSSLRINFAKLELVHVGYVNNVDGLVGLLVCKVSSLPLKYLDLSLGASFKTKFIWDGVIEKIERRLITFIKNTLSNLPTHFMSLFNLPTSLANHIEKLHRDFLWGGLGE
jgi:hypothetical protein